MSRERWRVLAVVALAAFGLLATLPGLAILWHPIGTYGLTIDADGVVRDVDPNSAAARAGIVPGDEIVGPLKRPVGEVWVRSPGVQTVATVVHAGRSRQVFLTSSAMRLAAGDAVLYPARKIIAALFILIGATLVLLRPWLATWGFFLYCVGDNPFATSGVLFATLPQPGYLLFILVRDLLNAAGIVGLLLFALNFPSIDVAPWRRILQRYLAAVMVLLALVGVSLNISAWLGSSPQWLLTVATIIRSVVYAAIAAVFVETYVRTRGQARQRVAWITFGFALGLVGLAFAHTLSALHWTVFSSVSVPERLLSLLIGVVPFIVAYSVVRHHVFDFNVVISQTLVYGVLTAAIVAFFAVLHAVAARALHSVGASLGVELVAALAIGFSLDAIRRRLARGVEALFFQRRKEARRQVEDAAGALAQTGSKEAVDALVVMAPAKAFDLHSAALFRRDENAYNRTVSLHWSASDDAVFFPDDDMVIALRRDSQALDLEKQHLPRQGMPGGDLAPATAFPIIVRDQLAAFALYGAQAGGAPLERDQVQALVRLAQAAAMAYDRLDFAQLQARAAEAAALRRELEALRASSKLQPM